MVPEGIDDAPQAPTIFILNWPHGCCSCSNRSRKNSIRIAHHHDHTRSASAERFWAVVVMLRRLVGEPELSTCDRHLGNHTAILAIDAEQLLRTKRRLIEFDGTRAIPNGKHCRNCGCFVAHVSCRLSTEGAELAAS